MGANVSSLERTDQGISIAAIVGGKTVQYNPKLIIDCGGFRSPVRPALDSWYPGSFDMVKYPSPSAGLKVKVLWMKADGGDVGLPEGVDLTRKEVLFSLRGITNVPNNQFVKLTAFPGLLKKPDGSLWRTFISTTLANHEIWKRTSAEAVYQLFEKGLP